MRRNLIFNLLDSGYKVGTAGSKGAGGSDTIQLFYGSEVAYRPNAETHLAGALQAVTDGLVVTADESCSHHHGRLLTEVMC